MRDIQKNPEYIQELIGLGSHATPTTVIEDNGESQMIIGFDQGKLRAALKLG